MRCTAPSSVVVSVKDEEGLVDDLSTGCPRCSDGSAAVAASDPYSESESSLESTSSFELAKRILGNEALLEGSRAEKDKSSKLFPKTSSSSSEFVGPPVDAVAAAGASGVAGIVSSSQQP